MGCEDGRAWCRERGAPPHCRSRSRPSDGTPAPFTRKSMYGPGGAAARLVGKAIASAAVDGEKLRGTRRWLWSKAWVTELRRISVTFVMSAASGVLTTTVCAYVTAPGTAPLMTGRGPWNR